MDNIRYSQKDATNKQLMKAAKIACVHDLIDKLPRGYHTMVSGATVN